MPVKVVTMNMSYNISKLLLQRQIHKGLEAARQHLVNRPDDYRQGALCQTRIYNA